MKIHIMVGTCKDVVEVCISIGIEYRQTTCDRNRNLLLACINEAIGAGSVKLGHEELHIVKIIALKNYNKFITADTEHGAVLEGGANDLRCLNDQTVTKFMAVLVIGDLQHIDITNHKAEAIHLTNTHSTLDVNHGLIISRAVLNAGEGVSVCEVVNVIHVAVDLIGGLLQGVINRLDLHINALIAYKFIPAVGKMLGRFGKVVKRLYNSDGNCVCNKSEYKNDEYSNKHHRPKECIGFLTDIRIVNVHNKGHAVFKSSLLLGVAVVSTKSIHVMLCGGSINYLALAILNEGKSLIVYLNIGYHFGDLGKLDINANYADKSTILVEGDNVGDDLKTVACVVVGCNPCGSAVLNGLSIPSGNVGRLILPIIKRIWLVWECLAP